jgi:hypothetical protein
MRVLNFVAIALISAVPQLAQSLQSDGPLNPPNAGMFRNLARQRAAQEFPKVVTVRPSPVPTAKKQVVEMSHSCAIPLLNATPHNNVHYTMRFVGQPKDSPAASVKSVDVCPGNPDTGWNAEPAPMPGPTKK